LGISIGCVVAGYLMLSFNEPKPSRWNDIPLETALGGEVHFPADNHEILRTPPVFTYFQDPEP